MCSIDGHADYRPRPTLPLAIGCWSRFAFWVGSSSLSRSANCCSTSRTHWEFRSGSSCRWQSEYCRSTKPSLSRGFSSSAHLGPPHALSQTLRPGSTNSVSNLDSPGSVSVYKKGRLANAFATGGLGAHLVVIGGGLLDRMSASELRAVLAHEIAHVAHGHVPRRILPLIVLGATLHVACLVLFVNPLFDMDEWPFLLAGIASAGASGGLFLIALPGVFMHKMEFQADRLAVELLGEGEPLIAALTKLADLNKHPLDAKSWSHPSTQARLDAIRALAANGHEPGSATTPSLVQRPASRKLDLTHTSRVSPARASPASRCVRSTARDA